MVKKHEKEEVSQEDAADEIVDIEVVDDMAKEAFQGSAEAYDDGAYVAGSDVYVVHNLVNERIDSHIDQRLGHSLHNGGLSILKKVEENLKDFLEKKENASLLEGDIKVFKNTLAVDQDAQDFITFMTLHNGLQGYRRQIQQAHQSPLARAIVVALGIPINALPGEALAAILYVVNTIACKILNDNESTGKSHNINQKDCAIQASIVAYFSLLIIFFMINLLRSFNVMIPERGRGDSPRFFPREYYRGPIAVTLRILFLMAPFIDEIKTDSLTNSISSRFPSILDAGQKDPFNQFYRQVSAYAAIPFLALAEQEDIGSFALLEKIDRLIQVHNNIARGEARIYPQLFQQIRELQRKSEVLERDIVLFHANCESSWDAIRENYHKLLGFNRHFRDNWREYFNLDRKTGIDEVGVMQFIDKTCEQYTEINSLVDKLKETQAEYQQRLNDLRKEFDEIKAKLTELKENKPTMQPVPMDENMPLIQPAVNVNYGGSSSSVSSSSSHPPAGEMHIYMDDDGSIVDFAGRSGGSPLHRGKEEGKAEEKEEEDFSSSRLRNSY